MLSYAFVLLHLSILLAGFTGVLGRLITLNEGLLVWYRVMFASVFFLMYLVVKNGQIKVTVKDALRIAWVGLLLSTLNTPMFRSVWCVLQAWAFSRPSLIRF